MEHCVILIVKMHAFQILWRQSTKHSGLLSTAHGQIEYSQMKVTSKWWVSTWTGSSTPTTLMWMTLQKVFSEVWSHKQGSAGTRYPVNRVRLWQESKKLMQNLKQKCRKSHIISDIECATFWFLHFMTLGPSLESHPHMNWPRCVPADVSGRGQNAGGGPSPQCEVAFAEGVRAGHWVDGGCIQVGFVDLSKAIIVNRRMNKWKEAYLPCDRLTLEKFGQGHKETKRARDTLISYRMEVWCMTSNKSISNTTSEVYAGYIPTICTSTSGVCNSVQAKLTKT